MSRSSQAIEVMPVAALSALVKLGADLAIARQRRREARPAWATRLNVSIPTLIRMEKGDPTVGMGVYATALWMMGRHAALGTLANPKDDQAALEQELLTVTRRHKKPTKETA
jgi:hypothetical protein